MSDDEMLYWRKEAESALNPINSASDARVRPFAEAIGALSTEHDRLTAELAELRAACEPFAKWCEIGVDVNDQDTDRLDYVYDINGELVTDKRAPTVGDLRRIAALLARTPTTETPR
jgi:hypothetical protein